MEIGELSRRTGLSPSAIRYYEQERLIPPAERRSGRRVFDEGMLAQLVVVQLAREAGFTLAEIRQLVNEFGRNRWRSMAERKLGEIRVTTERLRTMSVLLTDLLECECPNIEVCGRALRREAKRRGLAPAPRKRASRSAHP
jgi:MerR family redox-sensitive transcriptional activator SoxR